MNKLREVSMHSMHMALSLPLSLSLTLCVHVHVHKYMNISKFVLVDLWLCLKSQESSTMKTKGTTRKPRTNERTTDRDKTFNRKWFELNASNWLRRGLDAIEMLTLHAITCCWHIFRNYSFAYNQTKQKESLYWMSALDCERASEWAMNRKEK